MSESVCEGVGWYEDEVYVGDCMEDFLVWFENNEDVKELFIRWCREHLESYNIRDALLHNEDLSFNYEDLRRLFMEESNFNIGYDFYGSGFYLEWYNELECVLHNKDVLWGSWKFTRNEEEGIWDVFNEESGKHIRGEIAHVYSKDNAYKIEMKNFPNEDPNGTIFIEESVN